MLSNLKITQTKTDGRTLQIGLNDGSELTFEDCWLRDHCRCQSCYNFSTFQRANHILDIPDARVHSVRNNEKELFITWDDKHESSYQLEFLYENDYHRWIEGRRLKPILWYGPSVAQNVKKVHVDKFLQSVDGAKLVFQSLLDYGVAFVEGVEASVEATEIVAKALGGVQHTIFGGMWQFTSNAVRADTAYTTLPLATHNDNTYFTEAAGLQLLHCIEHTGGSGGDTVLADGYYGATKLKEEHPEDYHFLVSNDVEGEYVEKAEVADKGHHHRFSAPVIILDKTTKDLKQIRFNVYDRSTMPFANASDTRTFYRALRNLSHYYQDSKYQWQFKLVPGLIMIVDNFRVLHGRTAFTGHRVLCGSYVARGDWLDRARVLKLIK